MFSKFLPFLFLLLSPIYAIKPNFYLVSTTQRAPSHNSSHLREVSALCLFDPYYQTAVLLREVDVYGGLPTFNFSAHALHTWSSGPHGIGYFMYNSRKLVAGEELQFLPEITGKGNLGLLDGYLVTVNGKARGWTICDGQLSQRVVFWKGTDPSCKPVFLHAVAHPPY